MCEDKIDSFIGFNLLVIYKQIVNQNSFNLSNFYLNLCS